MSGGGVKAPCKVGGDRSPREQSLRGDRVSARLTPLHSATDRYSDQTPEVEGAQSGAERLAGLQEKAPKQQEGRIGTAMSRVGWAAGKAPGRQILHVAVG